MILKTPDGHYVEITGKEYTQFVAEIMVHFNMEKKLEITFAKDARIDAAKILLDTVAKEKINMSAETKENYFKTAHELIEKYNQEQSKK